MAIAITTTSQPLPKAKDATEPAFPADPFLLTALALTVTAKMSKKQLRKLNRKLAWESVKQKFRFRSKTSRSEKTNWALLIVCGALFVGTFVFAFVAGFGGALLKAFGIALAICLGLMLFS